MALFSKLLIKPSVHLAVIVVIAFAGMAGAIENIRSPYASAWILGLMILGFVAGGLGELRVKDKNGQGDNGGSERNREAKESQFVSVLAAALKLIQTHLVANGRYSESLAEADRGLLSSTNPEKVRAIIRALAAANEKMRRETNDLSASLEKSRQQVAQLSSKLVEAEEIGMRDPLTALANRRLFDANLAKEIADARSRATEMCLVMADIDHFKKVNDNFGHPFGDRVLKHFAELLTKNLKGRDTAARVGGEEFSIILPQTTLSSAAVLVEQIRGKLEAQQWKNAINGQLFSKITASFGIARLGVDDNSETLAKRADAMLYEAKRTGRNRIVSEAA
ncbi:MAG: GGDEF domain-containing protein [Roseiarcus sp.]